MYNKTIACTYAGRKRIGGGKMNYHNYINKKQISLLGFGAMRLPRFSDDQTDMT
jgi:hypothetical protein